MRRCPPTPSLPPPPAERGTGRKKPILSALTISRVPQQPSPAQPSSLFPPLPRGLP